MGDYTPADTTCEVLLTGEAFEGQFRPVAPLVDGLPVEVSATMVAGSGTGSYTFADWVEGFEVSVTTNDTWNHGGTITLTFTVDGVAATDVWLGLPIQGIVRQSTVSTSTDTITVVMTNTSGGAIPAGSRITRGAVWKQGWRK